MADVSVTRLAELAAYCRMDDSSPDDETLLRQLYLSAVDQMSVAGISEPTSQGRKASYDLCINYMVADALDRRAREVSGTFSENRAFRRLMNQLKQSEPVPESGTGGEEVSYVH